MLIITACFSIFVTTMPRFQPTYVISVDRSLKRKLDSFSLITNHIALFVHAEPTFIILGLVLLASLKIPEFIEKGVILPFCES